MEKKFRVPRRKKKLMRAYHLGFITSTHENKSKKDWESQMNTYQFYRALKFSLRGYSSKANAIKKRVKKSGNIW